MSLGKQAKILSKPQVEAVLGYLDSTRHPKRNRVIFLLSVKAGLRAKEIASLTWAMITDANGSVGKAIYLENKASKGTSGRIIPLNRDLTEALMAWRFETVWKNPVPSVVFSERASKMSPQAVVNLFGRWYETVGLQGCSSHSGRRTFITNAARKISTVGGSLRDVQLLAGHSNLRTTQGYIEGNGDAQVQVVHLVEMPNTGPRSTVATIAGLRLTGKTSPERKSRFHRSRFTLDLLAHAVARCRIQSMAWDRALS
jgi:integrase/recombinase XerD